MTESLSRQEYANYLAKLYVEQVTHARHHEVMRAQATNYILVASVALMSVLAAKNILGANWEALGKLMVCILAVVLNVAGCLLSMKHYERNRLHVDVASEYRHQASEQYRLSGFVAPDELRDRGREKHYATYRLINRVSLHELWAALHVIVAVLAIVLYVLETF